MCRRAIAPGLVRICLQHDRLLWQKPAVRAESAASLRGVVGRDEIRVRTPGPLSGQGEHPRPERGEHSRRRRGRLRGPVESGSLIHPIQIAAHGCIWPLVLVATDALDKTGMAHTQAKQEPLWVGLTQRELRRSHCERVTCPDVGDARCDHHAVGGRQQEAGVGQRLPVDRLADPQSSVAQLL
jgi:hypothetical protein